MLGNDNCEVECNVGTCGWDWGDCSNALSPVDIYVGGTEAGDGSGTSPFPDLTRTLKSLFLPFTHIHLLPGKHLLTSSDQPLLSQWGLIETTIEGPACTEQCPAILQLTRNFATFQLSHNVTFRNIHFSGAYELSESCSGEMCVYCPFVQQTEDGDWLNDRGEVVVGLYANQTYCEAYREVVFVKTTASLWLQNVTFEGFRQQLKALITTQCGDLVMQNVSFIRCMPSFHSVSGGLIQHLCPESQQPYNCGQIRYTGGTIRLLNDGYEYQPNILHSGFLSSQGILLIHLADLHFLANVVLVGEGTGQDAALLRLTDFRQLHISNCLFSSLIVDTAVLAVDSSLQFPLIVANGIASEQLLIHVFIQNCVFTNVTVLNGSVIALSYAQDHQNILLENVTIEHSMAAQSLFQVFNEESLPEDREGLKRTLKTVEIFFPPRYVTLTGLKMKGNTCVETLYLANVGNLAILRAVFEANGESKLAFSPFSSAFDQFKEANSQGYLRLTPTLASTVACKAAISLLGVLNLTFLNNNLTDNYCPSGISGLSLTGNVHLIQIHNNSFLRNQGAGALTLQIEQPTTLSNLLFVSNTNEITRYSVCMDLRMLQPTDVTITDSVFEGNSGWFSTVLFADNVKSLTLQRVRIAGNTAQYRCAGVLFNPYGTGQSTLLVADSVFVNNSASGYGVLSVMDYYGVLDGNTVEVINFTVSNCSFTDNRSSGLGAAITLGDYIDLTLDSRIKNCFFTNNQAEQGAGVVVSFQTGLLTIDNCLLIGNSAPLGAGFYLNPAAPSKTISGVHYRNCVFRGHKLGPAIELKGLSLNVNISSFNNTVKAGIGAIKLSVASLYDEGSRYTGQVLLEGPVLFAQDYSSVTLYRVKAWGNYATGSGGAIFLTGHTNLTLDGCEFVDNVAKNRGGALYADQVSRVTILNTTFLRNNATVASAIYACPAILSINSSLIANNFVSDFGSLFLSQCTAQVTSTTIRDNTSNGSCPGLILSNCDLNLTNVTMQGQKGRNGSFLQALDHNYVLIRKSSFQRGHAALMGGAFFASTQTIIDIYDSVFEDCDSGQEAGAIELQTGALLLSNCSFSRVTADTVGGVLVVREGTLVVQGSSFEGSNPEALYLFGGSSVAISDSVFLNSSSTGGGAIELRNIVYSLLQRNQFLASNGTAGGAIHYFSEATQPPRDQHFLTNNFFTDNEAPSGQGGGLYAENVDIFIARNTFRGNRADSGGAISTDCAVQSWCNVTILNNTFLNNTAKTKGGALVWAGAFPYTDGNVYEGNEAPYAPTVASYAIRLALVSASGAALAPLGTYLGLPLVHRVANFASGQTFTQSLLFGLYDHRNFLITTDSDSEAQLLALSQANLSLSGATLAGAASGLFTFSMFGMTAEPGSTQYLLLMTGGVNPTLHIKTRDEVEYMEKVLIEVQFRQCIAGESNQNGACLVCSTGTYSLDPTLPCLLCPDSAICYGNSTIVPKPGYWRQSNLTDAFIECLAPEACIGSPDPPFLSLTGLCATGYGGNLCQQCQPGYSSTGRNLCSQCPSLVSNITLTILISLLALVLVALIVWTAVKSAMRPQSLIAVYVKIFMNYLQMVVVSAALNLNWPTFAKTFLSGQQMAGGVAEQLFSVDCLVQDKHASGSLFFTKVKMYAGLPLVLFLLGILAWLLVAAFTKVEHLLKKLVATAVIVIFILHPSVTKVMFSLFSCMSLGDSKSYLVNDLTIECWNSDHLKEILTVVVPTMIIIVFGLPLLTLSILVLQRARLESGGIKVMLCFLYKGYVRPRYYWEFFILYRKVAMIAASVFLAQVSIRMQALTVLAILLLSLFLQVQVNPFFDPTLNRLEVKAILVSALTIYSGLYYDTNELSVIIKVLLFCLMVFSNAYFLISWIRLVSPVLMRTIRERLRVLFQWRKSYRVRALGSAGTLQDQAEKPASLPNFSSDMTIVNHSVSVSEVPSAAFPIDPPNTSMMIAREDSEEESKEPGHYTLVE